MLIASKLRQPQKASTVSASNVILVDKNSGYLGVI